MFKSVSALALFPLLTAQLALGAATEDVRCAESHDSLDLPQAAARTQWAFKCYPSLRGSMPNRTVTLKDTEHGTTFPGYPIFGLIDENGSVISFWQAPIDPAATCEPAQQYSFIGFCRAGCYTPDQLVLFSTGFSSILEAKNSHRDDIVTLSKDSTLENLAFTTSRLEAYTADPIEKIQKILVIRTQDGGELKVTLNHPLLDSKGRMRAANTLEVGEELIKMDGALDRIVSIDTTDYKGKVYNVRPASTDPKENIVVAQGYLNGSVYFQNEGAGELNRTALRAGNVIPDSLVQ